MREYVRSYAFVCVCVYICACACFLVLNKKQNFRIIYCFKENFYSKILVELPKTYNGFVSLNEVNF